MRLLRIEYPTSAHSRERPTCVHLGCRRRELSAYKLRLIGVQVEIVAVRGATQSHSASIPTLSGSGAWERCRDLTSSHPKPSAKSSQN